MANKKFYFIFFTVRTATSSLAAGPQQIRESEIYAVIDQPPILWLVDQLKAKNSIALKFFKEVSQEEFDAFIGFQKEKQGKQVLNG